MSRGYHFYYLDYEEKMSLKEIAEKAEISLGALQRSVTKQIKINPNLERIDDIVKTIQKNQRRMHGLSEENRYYYLDSKVKKSIAEIAKEANISEKALERNLREQKKIEPDLDRADKVVKSIKENQKRNKGTIEEANGERISMKKIAKENDLTLTSLLECYYGVAGQNLDEALRICRERKNARKGTYSYGGRENVSIKEIASKKEIPEKSLYTALRKTNRNINKAVLMVKNSQLRRARRKKKEKIVRTIKHGDISYLDLAVIIGIKYDDLMSLIEKGQTVDEIIKNYERTNNISKDDEKIEDGKKVEVNRGNVNRLEGLKEYCVSNRLNYACIYRAMTVYGRTLEEAEKYYRHEGQKLPTRWIHERYGLLLKHLLLKERIDQDKVIKFMRNDNLSLEEAVKKYIIRRNVENRNEQNEDCYIDKEWMEELYEVLSSVDGGEYNHYLEDFYVDDEEHECIIESFDEVERFKRKIVLFEIAEAIRDNMFTEEEMGQLFEAYNISEQDIQTIFLELFKGFKEPGVLMGSREPGREWSEDELKEIQKKIVYYQEILRQTRDEGIRDAMHGTVSENVGTNIAVRDELEKQLNNMKDKKGERRLT